MRKAERGAPPGPRNNRRENAEHVNAIFDQNIRPRNSAVTAAPLRLLEIPDERCRWCATPFEFYGAGKRVYCSKVCQKAATYEEHEGWRARRREALACSKCSAPIDGARRSDARYCPTCEKKARLDSGNKWRRKRAAEKRAATMSTLKCCRCSGPIADAATPWRKHCADCRRELKGERLRQFRAKTAQAIKSRRLLGKPPAADPLDSLGGSS
jgi:hypothetical protein